MKKKVLDVTKEKCPMTFLKVKIFIEENQGVEKVILVKGKKDFFTLNHFSYAILRYYLQKSI